MSDAGPPFILQQKNCQHKTALAGAAHLQRHVEIYVFVYIDCASVLIFCGFRILADHKLQVGFNLMHRSTFIDSIFYEMVKCSWQRLGSQTQGEKTLGLKSYDCKSMQGVQTHSFHANMQGQ